MNELQKHLLSMLKILIKVFDENGLEYHAIAGTCLGALLHRGFIPWDDDIDIAMPRRDYDRFIKEADRLLPEGLRLFGPCDAKHNDCLTLKLHDINTACIQRNLEKYPDRYTGAFIDIIPLDGFPKPGLRRFFFILRVKFWGLCNIVSRFFPDVLSKKVCPGKPRFEGFFKKYDRAVRKYDYETSEYTCYNNDLRAFTTRIIEKKNIGTPKTLPFEDIHIKVPENCEAYLHGLYGEYVAFPPEDKRETHDYAVLDLKTPYTEYARRAVSEGKPE